MMELKQLRDNISKKLHHAPDSEASVASSEDITPKHYSQPVSSVKSSSSPMAIGATIHIKGDVTGDEDLIIHGHVEGQVNLKDHDVIIGPKGRVKANIHAKQIVVEGELRGDLKGEENVIIRKTGNVLGNVISPRVTLEDGALFKGSIEMEPRESKSLDTRSHTTKVLDKSTTDKSDSATVKSSFV